MNAHQQTPASNQRVRQIHYLGPSPEDESWVVATVELSCGCQITRTLRERRIETLAGGRPVVLGELPCPTGHPTPRWMKGRRTSWLVKNALGR